MDLRDWLTIAAIIIGPILAVQIQKRIEILKEDRQRKRGIFHTLMATRAARVSFDHVRALNMIDLEFRRKKYKPILDMWNIYHDHLVTPFKEEELKSWTEKGNDLFIDLLYAMATSLGYEFSKVQLKRGIYSPRAHSDEEFAQLYIRDTFIDILSGKKAFPITVISPEQPDPIQVEMQQKLIEYLDGKRPVKVIVENSEAAKLKA